MHLLGYVLTRIQVEARRTLRSARRGRAQDSSEPTGLGGQAAVPAGEAASTAVDFPDTSRIDAPPSEVTWRTKSPWLAFGLALLGIVGFAFWRNQAEQEHYAFTYLGMRLTSWAALAALPAGVIVLWLVSKLEVLRFAREDPSAELEAKIKARESWAKIATAILVVVGVFAAASDQLGKSLDKQHAQQFADASKQLGNTEPDEQLTGLYTLERLAWDSPRLYEASVVGVIAGYVRRHAPRVSEGESAASAVDASVESDKRVHAAVAILGRLGTEAVEPACVDLAGLVLGDVNGEEGHFARMCLDKSEMAKARLRKADLSEAKLEGADLHEADLSGANLAQADLQDANLEGTILSSAGETKGKCPGADLHGADLTDAHLQSANLSGANLEGAILTRADLTRANLSNACLKDARLDGAVMVDANMANADVEGTNLTRFQIDSALANPHLRKLPDSLAALPIGLVSVFRGDHARSGWQPGPGPKRLDRSMNYGKACKIKDADEKEEVLDPGPIRSSAAAATVGDSVVLFFGSDNTCLYAIRVHDKSHWRFWSQPVKANAKVMSTPAVFDDAVYAIDDQGNLWIVGAGVGRGFSYKVDGASLSAPNVAIVEGRLLIIFGARNGSLRAVDPNTLDPDHPRMTWSYIPLPSPPSGWSNEDCLHNPDARLSAVERIAIDSSPAVWDGKAYVGSQGGCLYAVNAATGRAIADDPEAPGHWPFVLARDGCPPPRDVIVRAIQSTPAVVDGVVYFGSADHHLYAVDAWTGERLWCREVVGEIGLASPAVVDGIVYIGDSQRYLYAFDAKTGHPLWRANAVEELQRLDDQDEIKGIEKLGSGNIGTSTPIDSSPVVVDGVVYVGLRSDIDNGFVSMWDAATGEMLDAIVTDGQVWASPVVVDGVVYVGDFKGNFWAIKED